jgi:hypothetical protein
MTKYKFVFLTFLSIDINLQNWFCIELLNRLIKRLIVHQINSVACCCTGNMSPAIWFVRLFIITSHANQLASGPEISEPERISERQLERQTNMSRINPSHTRFWCFI